MDPVHRLNDAEIAHALEGKTAPEGLAACENCAAEFARWGNMGATLRQELKSRSEMPDYFWQRQQARIRDRLVPNSPPLRWAAAVLAALILSATAMVNVKPATEAPPLMKPQQTDPDEALLRDVQASLQQEVAVPLMPATVLVQEISTGSRQAQQVKEN